MHGLIGTARRLAKTSPKKPRQSDLRRAVSSAYYALFHAMAKGAADALVGISKAHRSEKAWSHAYRSLNHGDAKAACMQVRSLGFPPEIILCADAFVTLQENRHKADYDPNHKVLRADALSAISIAEQAISSLKSAPPKHLKAFAVQILMKKRRL